MKINRRQTLTGMTWSAPVILASTMVPAYAVSNESMFGFTFDGGGGANGFLNSTYLNFGTTTGTSYTLATPVTVTVNVVGLLTATNDERNFTAGSSNGSLSRQTYNTATHTTTFTWTIPAGTVVPPLTTGGTSLPDILFSFQDGLTGAGRLTNKIVITSVTGARLSQTLPIDSSIVKDINKGSASPDGIY